LLDFPGVFVFARAIMKLWRLEGNTDKNRGRNVVIIAPHEEAAKLIASYKMYPGNFPEAWKVVASWNIDLDSKFCFSFLLD
jgi:hypothetical protein